MKLSTSFLIILPFMALFNWNTSPIDPEFDGLWSQVEVLEKKAQPRAALEIVEDIIALAEQKDERPHWIKGIQYKANYIAELEEKGQLKAIDYLKDSKEGLPVDVRALVDATIAEKLKLYLQNQFYLLQDRTMTAGDAPDDMASWSVAHFEDAIALHFNKALVEKKALLKVETTDYKLIVDPGENSTHLTPTLYEFIAHRALEHFASNNQFAIEGIVANPIVWKDEFVSYDDFQLQTNITGADREHQALQLFRDMLDVTSSRSNKNSFVFTELKRLEYIHEKLQAQEEGPQYELLLTELLKTYGDAEEAALVSNVLANFYINKAQAENDKTIAGDLRIKAHDILSKAIKNYEKGYGVQQCQFSLTNLERPELSIQMEKVVNPNEASLLLLNYKGISQVRVRTGKLSREEYIRFQRDYKYRQNMEAVLRDIEVAGTHNIELKDNKNFTNYSSERILDPLDEGVYLIYVDNEEKDISSYHIVHSSRLGYAHTSGQNQIQKLIVFDRITGLPLPNVRVNLYSMEYRRDNQALVPLIKGVTNKNGYFPLQEAYERSYMVELINGEDRFLPFENIYTGRNYYDYDNNRTESIILTDRGIYRPGQSVHYKGIVFSRDEKNIPSLITNQEVHVEFVNPNGKVEETQKLKTNEFGSVNGIFTAPAHGLKGAFYVRMQGMGNQMVRVEEYKRPKFNVEIEAPDGDLVQGEEILVSGMAKTFAGTSVEGANVAYRVVRRKEYRYHWWSSYHHGSTDEKLIAVGNTQTDASGAFEVPFESISESEETKYWRPIYVYRITADVTDGNGETRTGTFALRIGSDPYYIGSDITPKVDADSFESFNLTSENAMGRPAKSMLDLVITKLIEPNRPLVNRLWQKADYPTKNENEFNRLFPHLAYDKTNNYDDWSKGKKVFSGEYAVEGSEKIDLDKKLSPGVYHIMAKDKQGAEKFTTYFVVYSFETSEIVSNEQIDVQLNKPSYQPGDLLKLMINSPFTDSKVFVQVEKDRQIVLEQWYELNNTKIIDIPVTENERGGFVVRLMHVVHGRFHNQQLNVQVPWNNKKLNITWETFRDKLLPGQDEVWRLKISGPDKESVMAEVLAGMYDVSLDEFAPIQWMMNLFPSYYSRGNLSFGGNGLVTGQLMRSPRTTQGEYIRRTFPSWRYMNVSNNYRYARSLNKNAMGNERHMLESAAPQSDPQMDAVQVMDEESTGMSQPPNNAEENSNVSKKDFAPRQNLNETVFFLPELKTDVDGNVIIEFKMNEALTEWKLQLLAYTKDLKSGLDTKKIVTQKNLMVFPQIPRFIREGDVSTISGKINKIIDGNLTGTAWIEIHDALDGRDITKKLVKEVSKSFDFSNKSQLAVDWEVIVPQGFIRPIEIVVKAQAGDHTDGELNTIPVLTNQILVTETLPMSVRPGEEKRYTFDALSNMSAEGVRPHRLTLEFMENPVWFAVQSMPYLTAYPHQCTEQIAHKIYANAIASHIIEQYPKIKEIFREWESKDELISNLNKNQELKSALIEETPWLRDAESEEEQMKNIALLFDYSRMADELNKNLDILFARQLSSGGFAWFAGGRSNVYITQLIVEIFGHLRALDVDVPRTDEWQSVVKRAMSFSLQQMQERYDRMDEKRRSEYLDATSLHAIYVTSFFTDLSPDLTSTAWKHYYGLAKKQWPERSLYEQALLSTGFYRFDEKTLAVEIVASFKDRALRSTELGMYWKYTNGYHWYNQPIETHAHIMEAIALVDDNVDDLNEMRIWLLKNKQTNRWSSTVSTAKAIYALLIRGDDWLGKTKPVYVKIGDQVLSSPDKAPRVGAQAGTGYFKKSWVGEEITNSMSKVIVKNPNEIVTWGAAYWQYFQAIDQVKKHTDNPLTIKRSVFKKEMTNSGEQLVKLENTQLKVGDKVTVRLEISVDRMMEFIHLKDLRAAGFEPVDVLSGYQWSGGLSYYQSTTDLGTHFFIDQVQVGTYVVQYDAFAVNAGDYTGGMATLQCMYAPEFASHSEGIRVQIKRD